MAHSPRPSNDESQPDVTLRLQEAHELKIEGNDHFREKKWDEALSLYRTGLSRLPERITNARDGPSDPTGDDDSEEAPEAIQTESDKKYAQARAILNANIAACHVKLGDHKQAVAACSQALLDDPEYVKALQRRAASNEEINSWSSLTTAQEDYTKLLGILPPSSPSVKSVKASLERIKPRVEAAQKQETAEMMSKLKGLGNSILGNFGLSTDNFKFEPNGQGGYSMNFTQ